MIYTMYIYVTAYVANSPRTRTHTYLYSCFAHTPKRAPMRAKERESRLLYWLKLCTTTKQISFYHSHSSCCVVFVNNMNTNTNETLATESTKKHTHALHTHKRSRSSTPFVATTEYMYCVQFFLIYIFVWKMFMYAGCSSIR